MSGMEHVVSVVSYARISYDKAGDAHGVADQHKVNRETSARLGWTVVHEFTDNDRSASKAEVIRDGFEAMLKAVKAGRLPDGTAVQGVVVVAEDRLARRSGDYERFVDALTAEDGRVYADARGRKDLYSEDVEGMGLVGVAFAKIESRKVRRRVRRSHRARAELGIPVGSQRPFGWQADKLTLEPAEAPLVATAVDQFIAGRSINSMVREWNDRGVVTAKGNRWTIVGLRQVLGNPRLCGWRKHNGELVTDAAGNPVIGRWEPIVTPEQWRAVEAILTARAGRRIGSDGAPGDMLAGDHWEHRYLLTGVLRCGRPRPDGTLCNARLRVKQQRDCAGHMYFCIPAAQGGCSGLGRRGDKVDEFITEAVLAKLEQRQAVAADLGPWTGQPELDRVTTKIGVLRSQWQADQISDGLFFTTVRELEERARELTRDRNRHEAAASRARMDITDVRRRWEADEIDLSQKRAYVREALHAVIVHPAGKGRGARGTFNPDLLEPIWRE
ncbi:recombinase family protein [Frankia sp. Mgl5]|uniref:recombinase family protein n=1 Tax=Frankia sp. Mgl5 TaxID=2933793 RepID=UPI00200C0881|nr:recombinase family protein [Frankia sp. Mgl5]